MHANDKAGLIGCLFGNEGVKEGGSEGSAEWERCPTLGAAIDSVSGLGNQSLGAYLNIR